jgi:Lipid A 3-O-deacylase (PagL)
MRRLLVLIALAAPLASAQQIDVMNISAAGGKSMTNWHGQAALQMFNFELGRSISKRTDVSFVFGPASIEQPRSWFGDAFGDGNERVHAISGSLLVRRHFRVDSDRAVPYVELSSGPMWANRRVPAATSRFNFISQAGVGVMLMPKSRFPVILGYRFAHISNGGYAPRNPGLNISSIVIGTRIRTGTLRLRSR